MAEEKREQSLDKIVEEQLAGQQEEIATNPELGIKRVRTFAEDLALAKSKAGIKEEPKVEKKKGLLKKKEVPKPEPQDIPTPSFDNVPPPITQAKPSPDIVPPVPVQKQAQPSQETIEEELARSGIVTQHKIKEDVDVEEKTSWLSPIRTYKNDAAESIEETGGSQISIVAAEQQKRAVNNDFSERGSTASSPMRSVVYLTLSIVLVAGSLWSGYFFYKQGTTNEQAQESNSETAPLLFVNKEERVAVGVAEGEEMLRLLNQARVGVSGGFNDIIGFSITSTGIFGENGLTGREFLVRIPRAPGPFARLVDERFLFAVHTGEKKAPVLLFKISDFETGFDALLDWEGSMSTDLAPLFGTPVIGEFEDVIIQNKDTRLLKNRLNQTVLLYGFPNTSTVVITTNENTFFEVFNRLASSKATRN